MKIGSNISSLQAQRRLGNASLELSNVFERLSTGQRINKASDDAAGLAVSASLNVGARIFSQGIRNLNDGVSLLNIADGAISNLTGIVTRLRELAQQSSSGSLGVSQRSALNAEAQSLSDEFTRIVQSTKFNGLGVFDGSIQGLTLQGGNSSIFSSIGGSLGTGTFSSSISFGLINSPTEAALGDLNGDGILDVVSVDVLGDAVVKFGNGDGSFGNSVSYVMGATSAYSVALEDVNNDGILDIIAAGGDASGGYASIRLGNGDGSFRVATSYQTDNRESMGLSMADLNGDGILDLVTVGNSAMIGGSGTIRLGNGDGTFRGIFSFQPGTNSNDVGIGDINQDGFLDVIALTGRGYAGVLLGNGNGTLQARTTLAMNTTTGVDLSLADLNGDGILDLVTSGTSGGFGNVTLRLGNGNGTFGASSSYIMAQGTSALAVGDINGDNILDILASGSDDGTYGQITVRLGNGDGSFKDRYEYFDSGSAAIPSVLHLGDLNGDGVLDILTDDSGDLSTLLGITRDGINPILDFSLETMADARQAITMLENKANALSLQRGEIGAFQSRLNTALSALGSKELEYKAAYSRITDVDVAQDSANLVKLKILQDVAAAVLAQANLQPSLAVKLIGGSDSS